MLRQRVGKRLRSKITPHMTLFYKCRRLSARQIQPVILPVRELVLIQSHYGHGRHTELGRWRFTQ